MEDNKRDIIYKILDGEKWSIKDKKELEEIKEYYISNKKEILKEEYKRFKTKKMVTGLFIASGILVPAFKTPLYERGIPVKLAVAIATGCVVGFAVNKGYNYYVKKRTDKKILGYSNEEEKGITKKMKYNG